MNCKISEIADKTVQILKTADKSEKFRFVPAFPVSALSSPLLKPTAGIGIKRIEFSDCSVGSYLGTDGNNNEIYGRKCSVTLCITLFCPRNDGGISASKYFEEISDMLLCSELSEDISSVVCNETVSDRTSGCFVIDGDISLSSVIYTAVRQKITAQNFTVEGETI
ncbi:MAG: hypothetical protein ACI4QV_03085 [Acutalibacteraceae bacterium]